MQHELYSFNKTYRQPATKAWLGIVNDLIIYGEKVEPRGKVCFELLAYRGQAVSITHPIIVADRRKLGYKFMAAEAAWILSGHNAVQTIAPYSRAISQFSDDGWTYSGAYGPMIRDQLRFVASTLAEDTFSRQAVMTIWRPNPRPSKDIPCTVALQFLIRDGELNCIATMRSSDVWLGWVYDVFNFSMLTWYLKLGLRKHYGVDVGPGSVLINAGSQHLYAENVEAAVATSHASRAEEPGPNLSFIDSFAGPDLLINELWSLAEKDGVLGWVK